MVIETRLGSVGYGERWDLCEMSGRYASIGHDGVIILNRLTAHNPVFDVTTQQTMSTNELHQFSKIRTPLAHLWQNDLDAVYCGLC